MWVGADMSARRPPILRGLRLRRPRRLSRNRSRNAPRWRRHGIVRPTLLGWVMLLLGGCCAFFAALLDDRALSAATVAIWLAMAVSLMLSLVQRWLVSGDEARDVMASSKLPITRDGLLAYVPARGWRRFILPHSLAATTQWERLDQRGEVIGRGAGAVPERRGRYRHVAMIVTWHDPFGLILQRKLMAYDGETLVLPEPAAAEQGNLGLAADARLQSQSSNEDAGTVRNYVPGDSPRLISWRHTAHYGELMTRESDRDARVTTLMVVDVTAAAHTDLDAAVASALRVLRLSRHGSESVVASDGEVFCEGEADVTRFLAAVVRREDGPDAITPDAIARAVSRKLAAQHHPTRVVLLTAERNSPVARAFAASSLGAKLTVEAVGRADANQQSPLPVTSFVLDDSAEFANARPRRRSATRAGRDQGRRRDLNRGRNRGCSSALSGNANARSSRSAHSSTPPVHPWRRHMRIARIAMVVSLVATTICTVAALSPMISGGLWQIVLIVGVAAVSIAAIMFPPRSAWRSALRTVLCAVLTALAACGLVVWRLRAAVHLWPIEWAVEPVTNGSGEVIGQNGHWVFVLEGALRTGINDLGSQSLPIRVSLYGDLVMILLAAAIVVLIRCLLTQPMAAAVTTVFPIVAMVGSSMLVGQQPSLALIGATVFAGLMMLWAARPVRAVPATSAVAATLITAVTLALTPGAQSIAVNIPLTIGTAGGVFTTSTINPLVDLKRGLNSGSESIVFRYSSRSGSPYYFRMATLSDFDGDSWRYEPQLAADAELYGGTVNLSGRPEEYTRSPTRTNWDMRSLDPMMRVLTAVNMLSSYAYYDQYRTGESGAQQPQLSQFQRGDLEAIDSMIGNTTVTIETLGSRFLPVTGTSSSVDVSDGAVIGWYRADDGTVFSRDYLTSSGMRYMVYGGYLRPISDADGFEQLEVVNRLRDGVISALQTMSSQLEGYQGDRSGLRRMGAANLFDDAGTGAALRDRYGEAPDELPEHIRAVVDEAKAAGVPSDGSSEYAQIAAMQWLVNYFKQPGFTYSLEQPDGNGRNNLEIIDDFLATRSGYCTHYASAMAILARALGLSSRMVLGYGDSSRLSGDEAGSATTGEPLENAANITRYDVLAKQLHAWTEVYIDNIGWVPFDMTPPSDDSGAQGAGDNAATSSDADETAQDEAADSASPSPSSESDDSADFASDDANDRVVAAVPRPAMLRFPGWVRAVAWVLLAAILLAALVLTPAAIRSYRRRRRYARIRRAIAAGGDDALNRDAWRAAWSEMLDCAQDAGITWPSDATDSRIAETIANWQRDSRVSDNMLNSVGTIAANALAATYGDPSIPVAQLDKSVMATLSALQPPDWRGRLLPRSLRRR